MTVFLNPTKHCFAWTVIHDFTSMEWAVKLIESRHYLASSRPRPISWIAGSATECQLARAVGTQTATVF